MTTHINDPHRPSPELIAKLKTLGEPAWHEWFDYSSIDVKKEDSHQIISILENDEEYWESEETQWIPIHAWRLLSHLKTSESPRALIDYLIYCDDDEDWALEDIPEAIAKIGEQSLPEIKSSFEHFSSEALYNYVGLIVATGKIAAQTRSAEALSLLRGMIKNFKFNHPTINSFVVIELVDLLDQESIKFIEESFAQKFIDTEVIDWDFVRKKFLPEKSDISRTPKSSDVKPSSTDFSYSGDESFQKLLNNVGSALTVAEVKLLILGTILAVEMVPPSQIIGEILKASDDEDTAFSTDGQAQITIKEIMGLWNVMANFQNEHFTLKTHPLPETQDSAETIIQLLAAVIHREREIHNFIFGLELGNTSASTLHDPNAKKFLGALEKQAKLLEELSELDGKPLLMIENVAQLLKEIDELWNQNFLNFARSTKESRVQLAAKQRFASQNKHVGRNEPCPCGSGKKLKKCCLQ